MKISRAALELLRLEKRSGTSLDDDSARLLARLRTRRVLGDRDWSSLQDFYAGALGYLAASCAPPPARKHSAKVAVSLDADPRNADWIRIVRAFKLAGFRLPRWAALWLWWLKTDTSPPFWRRVGEIARSLGYEPFNTV